MKKHFFMVVAAAGMLAACTNSQEPAIKQGDGEQVIRLKVSSTGDGLTTRAGRDLFSEEAGQAIDNVKLVIVDADNKVVSQTTIGRWSEIANPYSTGGHGMEATAKIPSGERVTIEGTYTIYAYGYSTDTEYSEIGSEIGQVAVGSMFDENQLMTLKESSVKIGEEIFAGAGQLTVAGGNNSAEGSVTLNRQVAGTFGYFKNIPYINGGTKLVLKTYAQLNDKLVIGGFGSNSMVNGAETSSNTTIYTINIGDWFDEIAKDDDNSIAKTGWTNPYKEKGVIFEEGSVFGGTFLFPFAVVSGKNTLVLELQNDDEAVLRSWTIKLPSDDAQTKAYTRWAWDGNTFTSTEVTEDVSSYSILRNHLYSVGTRTSGADAPVDLNKDQILTLKVSDEWEAIHNMVVD